MKQIIFIMALVSGLALQAQKKDIRLYGFSQEISRGIRKAAINEKGETVTEKKQPAKDLMIYLEVPVAEKIEITELWIQGKSYRFDTSIHQGPVLLNTGISMPGQQDKVLINATSNRLVRLLPIEPSEITVKANRKLAKYNEVVVYFKRNGKQCQRMLEKIQEVEKMVTE